MTSVLIVEDQRMPRENMEHLVEDSGRYRRVASLSTAEMALAQCARHTVDLVLMDVCTKGSRDGIDVAAEIKARYPETKVIIITSMVEESYLKRAKAAGAESFWYKDVSPESLLEVMDRTMAGESLYPDRTPETRLRQVSSTQLTPREIEVLRLVCEGLEYEEIAAELGISSRTVKRFVSSLLEKPATPTAPAWPLPSPRKTSSSPIWRSEILPCKTPQSRLAQRRKGCTKAKPARETDPPAKGGLFYAHFAPKSAKLWNTPEILEKLWAEHRKIFTVLSLMAHAEPRGGVVSLIQ